MPEHVTGHNGDRESATPPTKDRMFKPDGLR
jgi:hypothetical protein